MPRYTNPGMDKSCCIGGGFFNQLTNGYHILSEFSNFFLQVCSETKVTEQRSIVGVQKHVSSTGPIPVGPAPIRPALASVHGPVAGVGPALRSPGPAVGPAAPAAPAVVGGTIGHNPHAAKLTSVPAVPHGINKRDSEAKSESDGHGIGAAPISGSTVAVGAGPVALGPTAVSVSEPVCQSKIDRVCKDIPVQVPRHVEVPKCIAVPKTHCTPITKVVPGPPACHDEPRKVCKPVSRQVPFEVPVEKCHQVPQQVCKDVPQKVARQVCETSYQGAAYGHGYGYGGYGNHY